MSNHVIIFGPTGNIGSVAARTAQEHGAKVFLAMRDPAKPIPGLTAEQEKSGGFERIQADLSQPETVAAAIHKSGAKRAFIYLVHGSTDHMKSTIEALKSAGVQFLVFLSSYTIPRESGDVPQHDIIPFIHAQVENNIAKIFQPQDYVFVRPGGFATNSLWWKAGINAGEVKLYCPDVKFDYISHIDMGKVSGTILVKGPQDGDNIVYLYGPRMVSQKDAVLTIGKALDRDVKVTSIDAEEGVDIYKGVGMPDVLAKYLVKKMNELNEEGPNNVLTLYETGVSNIQKYTGKPAMTFQEWAKENKQLFNA